jgi:CDP-diacylglycerol--glycerol-3-phosphate 3-phosphatidyltransferase
MNLPNTLTLARIFLVPLLVAALVQQNFFIGWSDQPIANEFLALIIFLAAAATDLLDGYLARRWGQVTTVGTLLDPIADKLLISSALIALVEIHRVPAWMVILIVGREFAVSGLRSIAAAEGYTIEASELGKTKMAVQVLAIALVMVSIHYPAWTQAAMICMWGVVIFAMLSAFDYFRKFWRRVDDKVKLRRRRELLRAERLRQRRDRAARTALNPKAG